jgi:DNA-binding FrmR family transcriptional regulator
MQQPNLEPNISSPSNNGHEFHTHEHHSHESQIPEHHDPEHHGHVHDEESQKRILNRLSRIEGHIRGIKLMVQENRACPDVLIQIAAVRGALNKVARIILDEHLTECVTRAAGEGDIELEIAELQTALDHFL